MQAALSEDDSGLNKYRENPEWLFLTFPSVFMYTR